MPDAGIQEPRFSLTESAARRIAVLRQDEAKGDALMMRVAVLGGGCSGFQYKFGFDETVNDDDQVFEVFAAFATDFGTIDKVLKSID